MPDSNEDLQIKLEEIKQQGETARQSARLAFYGTIFTGVTGIVTSILVPVMLRSYHMETLQKVQDNSSQVQEVGRATAVAIENTSSLEKKADTNLLQWKAYHSRDESDIQHANNALVKAEKDMK